MDSLESLKLDLLSEMKVEQLFQKHIIDGSSYYFRDHLGEHNQEYELRHDLSDQLGLSINDIVIVGSAKLGFSVKNEKFLKFDAKFSDTNLKKDHSDIDVAIVNRRLFDTQAATIYEISRHFEGSWINDNWKSNYFYRDKNALQRSGVKSLFTSYTKNIARGWLRLDYAPNIYINSAPWKEIVKIWQERLERKVTIAIYSEWHYLKHYQMDNLLNLRRKIKALEIK